MANYFQWTISLRGNARPVILANRHAPVMTELEKRQALSLPVLLRDDQERIDLTTLAAIFGPAPQPEPSEPRVALMVPGPASAEDEGEDDHDD